jgi:hypothetical protein
MAKGEVDVENNKKVPLHYESVPLARTFSSSPDYENTENIHSY